MENVLLKGDGPGISSHLTCIGEWDSHSANVEDGLVVGFEKGDGDENSVILCTHCVSVF